MKYEIICKGCGRTWLFATNSEFVGQEVQKKWPQCTKCGNADYTIRMDGTSLSMKTPVGVSGFEELAKIMMDLHRRYSLSVQLEKMQAEILLKYVKDPTQYSDEQVKTIIEMLESKLSKL